ncbi:pimeloyl-ACP methyl ester carboxylesterase [Antricoccus suffuscus]|uniref:Pimeloyl-ACP methyl ester carboxylesterase n=1 Tax=Antricoccus suffuscus TaxID=1629062 RepID=A0A2T1A078_9ACTN|nr:alpha/beta hydrolase [Antricoccus suffuscus]PRZ41887.1 pimeloyl-ACP methyl ester carboxylesterase [Antricoccus suffuscus]
MSAHTSASDDWTRFVDQWVERARADDRLRYLARDVEVAFTWRYGDRALWMSFRDGRLDEVASDAHLSRTNAFDLVAPAHVWDKVWQQVPPRHFQGIFAIMMRCPEFHLAGDHLAFAQNAHIVRRLIDLAREPGLPYEAPALDNSGLSNIIGRYLRVDLADGPHRIYVEEAGEGQPLLMLHTAGSDSRQFQHLMANPGLQKNYRMIAFDLPLHGRSDPECEVVAGKWSLTTSYYHDAILRVVEELGLRDPIAIGSSMGGEICLELAISGASVFRGVVACQASSHIDGRMVRWAGHPQVNESLFNATWVADLMSPSSPERYRDEVWWQYSQGGHGIFRGDIDFYSGDWDARDRVSQIDTAECKVVILNGEYDYSCTAEHSKETADQIAGAQFTVMKNLGHFPMSENPALFLEYLEPALEHIQS